MQCRGAKTEKFIESGMKFLTKRHTAVTMIGIAWNADRESNESDRGTAYRSTFEVTPMHIPDALLDPKVAAVTGLVGAAGLLFGLRRLEREHGERTTVLMGTMAAFVFAAQMVNFPAGPGVSGHLLGGVLASVLLGPWAAAVVIAAVLLVQCFLFGDGGLTALGANFVNMGLIGAVGGYAIYSSIRHLIAGRKGILIAAMVAAWFSVLLAAGAFSIELGVTGDRANFVRVLTWMTLVHAVIGMGESVITGLVVRFLLVRRPDLFESHDALETKPTGGLKWGQTILGGLAIALAVAVFLGPFASEQPDGLEFVGEKLGFLKETTVNAVMLDYQFPGLAHVRLATAVAGLIGTLAVFVLGWGMSRVLTTSIVTSNEATPDAA
jgi:cobalt/nickel transport system permease protein